MNFPHIDKEKIQKFLDALGDINTETILNKLIPLWGRMSDEEKKAFILLLVEALARGAAQGAANGMKDK